MPSSTRSVYQKVLDTLINLFLTLKFCCIHDTVSFKWIGFIEFDVYNLYSIKTFVQPQNKHARVVLQAANNKLKLLDESVKI